jgi:hypothetical protein
MTPTRRVALAVLLSLLALDLCGCNAWQHRAEFAAPESRWGATQPSPVAADAPPPAVREQYCYRTLATVDCFTAKQADRYSGYTGTYPE